MRGIILRTFSIAIEGFMLAALAVCPALAQDSDRDAAQQASADATAAVTPAPQTAAAQAVDASGDASSQDQQPQSQQQPPAQSQQPQPQQPAPDQKSDQKPEQKPQPAPATPTPESDQQKTGGVGSNQRLFFAIPNYLTVENGGKIQPLTPGEKFKIVARGALDPVELGTFAVLAGISQADNSEPGYGQGAQGYAKRYGAAFGDGVIENFMVGAIFPTVLRTDPRFFQMGKGGFKHRAGYVISRIFVTRTDSGHETFNASEIFGSAFAAGISTYSYHPGNDRNVGNALTVWGTQIGFDSATLMLKEFWPDVRHFFRRNK